MKGFLKGDAMHVKMIYGWGVILLKVSFGDTNGFRIKLSENSICPDKVIEFYPENMPMEFEPGD